MRIEAPLKILNQITIGISRPRQHTQRSNCVSRETQRKKNYQHGR